MNRTSLLTLLVFPMAVSLNAGEFTHDADAGYSASAGARTNLGNSNTGDVSGQNAHFQYVLSYTDPGKPIFRAGIAYDRFDFGLPSQALLPGTLQSSNLVLGLDFQISDFLVRLEAQPGIYSTFREISSRDVNVPIVIGISWLVNKDLQWIAGLSVDANRDWPVLGGISVRWKFADRWVLNAIPPNPRLEFKATDDLTLFAGGHVLGSTFRVDGKFGTSHGDPRFNHAVVAYTEVRAGAGIEWKINTVTSVDFELGYMAYRDFDFHRLNENFETKGGAFYGQAGVSLRW